MISSLYITNQVMSYTFLHLWMTVIGQKTWFPSDVLLNHPNDTYRFPSIYKSTIIPMKTSDLIIIILIPMLLWAKKHKHPNITNISSSQHSEKKIWTPFLRNFFDESPHQATMIHHVVWPYLSLSTFTLSSTEDVFIQNYCSEQRRTWWHGQQNYSTCWEISVHILHQTGVWTDQFTSVRCWLSSPLGTTGQLWGCRKRSSFVTSWLLHKSKVRCLASRSSFQHPKDKISRYIQVRRWRFRRANARLDVDVFHKTWPMVVAH